MAYILRHVLPSGHADIERTSPLSYNIALDMRKFEYLILDDLPQTVRMRSLRLSEINPTHASRLKFLIDETKSLHNVHSEEVLCYA